MEAILGDRRITHARCANSFLSRLLSLKLIISILETLACSASYIVILYRSLKQVFIFKKNELKIIIYYRRTRDKIITYPILHEAN